MEHHSANDVPAAENCRLTYAHVDSWERMMGTYVPYSFYTQWGGGIADGLALAIFGEPDRYRIGWGDGSAQYFDVDDDLNGDGVADAAVAFHQYAADGVYTITVRPEPADDLPPRQLRVHVHAHTSDDGVAKGNARDEMFLMGQGNDIVRTGDGINWVSAGAGADVVVGGSASDVIDGGAGDDVLRGGGGQDQLFGGDGHDVLRGTGGLDMLDGGSGDDRLHAEGGGNYLFGGAGRDILRGGDGGNVLNGGAGIDRLTGGAGGDIFQFGPDGPERDVITDFDTEGRYAFDYIDLSLWGPGQHFIDGDRFSGAAGEVRAVRKEAMTLIFGDVDGDRVADYSIAVLGKVTLSADDFLF